MNGPNLDQSEDLICEDGVNVCAPTETDCCEMIHPACWTATQYDRDGFVLVTACRTGFGCQS